MDLIGTISVPESLLRTPVTNNDAPPVNIPAAILPPDAPLGFSHSTRSAKIETFAFLPPMCELNSSKALVSIVILLPS
jgi:hypothetical protein